MSFPAAGSQEESNEVPGFEVPRSPDSSYNNLYSWSEEDGKDPPLVPPHLHHSLVGYPTRRVDPWGSAPLPQNCILNHLYVDNTRTPQSVMAVGITHRFRSRFVTVVLYTPVQNSGSSSRN